MTALNEITHLLHRWFAEHQIEPDGFTLILNFKDTDPAARFDCAVRAELERSSFLVGTARSLDLRSFKMNGMDIRIESPIHEPA